MVYQIGSKEIDIQLAFCQVSGFFQIENYLVYRVRLGLGDCSQVWRMAWLLGCAVYFVLFFWSRFMIIVVVVIVIITVFFSFMLGLDFFVNILLYHNQYTKPAICTWCQNPQETSRRDAQKDWY